MKRALILCGASGAGKSSVGSEICRVLAGRGTPCAFVDADTVAQFGPAPRRSQEGASFYDSLKCKNVGSLWLNFRDAGALYLVVAAHIGCVQLRTQYEQVLEDCAVQVALLTAPTDLIRERLAMRPLDPFHWSSYTKDGTVRQRMRERVAADQARLEASRAHDFAVVNDAALAQAATRVLELAGWSR